MKLKVRFYKTSAGNEPVREWLNTLGKPYKTVIGFDIKTVQLGWPLGMPLVRKIQGLSKLWEVRSDLPGKQIARVFFTVIERNVTENEMILLHAIIKKSKKIPQTDIELASKRKKEIMQYE